MVALNSLTRKVQKLEDLHCLKNEANLRRQLLQSLAVERAKWELAKATGTDDPDLIDQLFKAGFTAESLPAISLIPIALVAWGSGFVTDEERLAAMKAIYDSDLSGNDAAIGMFQSWLDSRPGPDLLQVWAAFTKSQVKNSRPSIKNAQHDRMLRLASDVALASGGFLGYGAICDGEQTVLDRIRDVFIDLPDKAA